MKENENQIVVCQPDEVMRLEMRFVDGTVAKTEAWLNAL